MSRDEQLALLSKDADFAKALRALEDLAATPDANAAGHAGFDVRDVLLGDLDTVPAATGDDANAEAADAAQKRKRKPQSALADLV